MNPATTVSTLAPRTADVLPPVSPQEPPFLKSWLAHHLFDPLGPVLVVLVVLAVVAVGLYAWWAHHRGDPDHVWRARIAARWTLAGSLLTGIGFAGSRALLT